MHDSGTCVTSVRFYRKVSRQTRLSSQIMRLTDIFRKRNKSEDFENVRICNAYTNERRHRHTYRPLYFSRYRLLPRSTRNDMVFSMVSTGNCVDYTVINNDHANGICDDLFVGTRAFSFLHGYYTKFYRNHAIYSFRRQ